MKKILLLLLFCVILFISGALIDSMFLSMLSFPIFVLGSLISINADKKEKIEIEEKQKQEEAEQKRIANLKPTIEKKC